MADQPAGWDSFLGALAVDARSRATGVAHGDTAELGGEVILDYARDGLRCEIAAGAPKVSAA